MQFGMGLISEWPLRVWRKTSGSEVQEAKFYECKIHKHTIAKLQYSR